MQKIPTLFVRDPEDRRYVTDEVTPGCEWVLAGEGVATRKFDGTCVMLDDQGGWWARRGVKPGRVPPRDWVLVDHDDVTGKSVGWEPVEASSFHRWFCEAALEHRIHKGNPSPGTYELIGPKINGNPEHFTYHALIKHSEAAQLGEFTMGLDGKRNFATIRGTLHAYAPHGFEGIVWHWPQVDGSVKMAKLKVRDLGPSVAT